ncbi:hypothetical protein [Streptomyces sp. NPDC059649]|uniref:hypothetical protein n=1 Tax=Streptomyces sp. NPDC059649 TaxID=3346895 RepID=UPI0036AA64B5
MLIRDVTWREIDNAADLPLIGGFRVLADWLCIAAAVRPCPTGKLKTGCGKRHLFWETPRASDGIVSGYTGDQGDRLGVTVGRTIIGAATGSIVPIFLPNRKDHRTGSFTWVPGVVPVAVIRITGAQATAPSPESRRARAARMRQAGGGGRPAAPHE